MPKYSFPKIDGRSYHPHMSGERHFIGPSEGAIYLLKNVHKYKTYQPSESHFSCILFFFFCQPPITLLGYSVYYECVHKDENQTINFPVRPENRT